MFIIKFLRILLGYVHFKAWGNFLERFINMTAANKITLWDMKKKDGVLYAKTSVKNYKRIRPYARKAHIRCRVIKRKGLPFIIHKYRHRAGILLGALIFAVLLIISSRFIWSITITGNETVTTQEIYSVLEELGLKIGTYKSDIDYRILEEKAMMRLEGLSWMGIITKGSSVFINVKERTMPPEYIASDIPCNVKAAKDGFILRMEVYEGKTIVKTGNSVLAGDLIISGILEDSKGNSLSIVHARAKVIAQTEFTKIFYIPLNIIKKEYTNTVTRYSLSIFNFAVPLYFNDTETQYYDTQTEKTQVDFFGIVLPIYLTKENILEYEPVTITLTKDQAKAIALEQLEEYENTDFKGKDIVITSRITSDEVSDSEYLLKVTYYAQEDIAIQEEIGIDLNKIADK